MRMTKCTMDKFCCHFSRMLSPTAVAQVGSSWCGACEAHLASSICCTTLMSRLRHSLGKLIPCDVASKRERLMAGKSLPQFSMSWRRTNGSSAEFQSSLLLKDSPLCHRPVIHVYSWNAHAEIIAAVSCCLVGPPLAGLLQLHSSLIVHEVLPSSASHW